MSEHLFVLNPEIVEYPKRYIWGIGKESFRIFEILTGYRIPVDGFISDDEDEVGMTLINKPVISLDMIEDRDKTLILSDHDLQIDYNVLTEIITYHKSFTAESIVIYGAGYMGKFLATQLSEKGVKVDCFIDRDKYGQKLAGIPIYSPQIINEMDDNVVILEAGKYWQEMEDVIKKANPRIQTFHEEDKPLEKYIRVCGNKLYYISFLVQFAESFPECFSDRKIILLGNDIELARGYKEVLECVGYKKISFMVTDEELVSEDVHLLDEIIYEESYLILLYEYGDCRTIIDKIEELGIADSDWTSLLGPARLGHCTFMLDVNLGYTYKMNYEPGLYLHGKEKENNVKIVTLGGSIVEENAFLVPSWPKIMFEKYGSDNITLYNGGVRGYTSSYELIKMARDILYLEPDIIVVYDGFVDITRKIGDEFISLYNIINYAKKNNHNIALHSKVDENIFLGLSPDSGNINKWLNNIKSMYGIAKVHNIKFHSFMQPMICTQKIHSKHGLSLQKMSNLILEQELGREAVENIKLFREYAKDIEKEHSYIHDLSHIFDEKDVYMDTCHVWESGNEIIADSIWEVIDPDVREIMERKASN